MLSRGLPKTLPVKKNLTSVFGFEKLKKESPEGKESPEEKAVISNFLSIMKIRGAICNAYLPENCPSRQFLIEKNIDPEMMLKEKKLPEMLQYIFDNMETFDKFMKLGLDDIIDSYEKGADQHGGNDFDPDSLLNDLFKYVPYNTNRVSSKIYNSDVYNSYHYCYPISYKTEENTIDKSVELSYIYTALVFEDDESKDDKVVRSNFESEREKYEKGDKTTRIKCVENIKTNQIHSITRTKEYSKSHYFTTFLFGVGVIFLMFGSLLCISGMNKTLNTVGVQLDNNISEKVPDFESDFKTLFSGNINPKDLITDTLTTVQTKGKAIGNFWGYITPGNRDIHIFGTAITNLKSVFNIIVDIVHTIYIISTNDSMVARKQLQEVALGNAISIVTTLATMTVLAKFVNLLSVNDWTGPAIGVLGLAVSFVQGSFTVTTDGDLENKFSNIGKAIVSKTANYLSILNSVGDTLQSVVIKPAGGYKLMPVHVKIIERPDGWSNMTDDAKTKHGKKESERKYGCNPPSPMGPLSYFKGGNRMRKTRRKSRSNRRRRRATRNKK